MCTLHTAGRSRIVYILMLDGNTTTIIYSYKIISGFRVGDPIEEKTCEVLQFVVSMSVCLFKARTCAVMAVAGTHIIL